MTHRPQRDPLPALIETWIQELSLTRYALERLLAAVAHVLEDGEESGFERRMLDYHHSYEMMEDRLQAETEYHLQGSPERILLAMIHATGNLRTEQSILTEALVEMLSQKSGVPAEDVRTSIDQEKLDNPYPPPSHGYTPHILRSLFRKTDTDDNS